uniref:C2 PI3K-type domain-containing protein n=1 Tax=Rodentolepis nana TaxID=102285 RepID=A0A0R3TFP3_RODNA
LDLHTNRLIYRSGITPETPGGQSWFALDLLILPTFDDELKVGTSGDQEGPLLPLCPSQEEVIQLIGRVLQLTNLSIDHTDNDNLERLSIPEDYDASAIDQLSLQIPSTLILNNKIRRLFTSKHQNRKNNFFGSLKHLHKDSSWEKIDSSSCSSENQSLPKVGNPPARLTFVWAGAMNCPVEQDIPIRWRIASLLTCE